MFDVFCTKGIFSLFFMDSKKKEFFPQRQHLNYVILLIDIISSQSFDCFTQVIHLLYLHKTILAYHLITVQKHNRCLYIQESTYLAVQMRSSVASEVGMPARRGIGASKSCINFYGKIGKIRCSHLRGYRKEMSAYMTYPSTT